MSRMVVGPYPRRVANLKDICIDCENPWTLAQWWAPVLGHEVRPYSEKDLAQLRSEGIEGPEGDPYVATDPVEGDGPTVWFNRVPEPRNGKNRIHIDVYGDAEALVAAGARLVERHPNWTVLADPEGNEFCVFPQQSRKP